jgi:polyhydroxybutyrate depolymerase
MRLFRTILPVLLSAVWMAGPGMPSGFADELDKPGDHEISLKVGDLERRYVVHVPKGYDGKKPVPVVIMFHGGGGTAKAAMKETGWADKADQVGFLAVFPEGSAPDPSKPGNFRTNPQTWNDGSGRFHAGEKHIDDVRFTNALLNDLIARFKVDQRRVYVTGFSNGSSLVYRLGAELAPRLAAIAPVASSGLKVKEPKLSRPVPMITIQGSADPRNPLEGGEVNIFGKVEKRPSPRESVSQWAKLCGCPEEPKTLRDKDGVKAIAYGPGKDSAEVVFYVVEGMGHTWPGGVRLLPESLVGKTTDKLKANDVIWEFFEKHPLPAAPDAKKEKSSTGERDDKYAVGYRILDVTMKDKKLAVAVWYPTDAKPKGIVYSTGHKGTVGENAPVKEGQWPLVVLSHGFGGSGIGQVAVTEALAAHGWIVAAPDHTDPVVTHRIQDKGNGDFEALRKHLREHPFDRKTYAYRPLEVQAVLDALLANKDLPIDREYVALAGHSMGGWSVMTVTLQDQRVKAVVLYSMGELNWLAGNRYFEKAELAELKRPSIYLFGADEKKLNRRGVYAEYCFEHSSAPCYLVEIAGGNHFTYNDRALAPRAGGSAEQHQAILGATRAFLEKHVLKKA